MAISYPFDISAIASPTELNFSYEAASRISESPYNFNQQVFQYTGGRWFVEAIFKVLTIDEVKPLQAALVGLQGNYGTFTIGPVLGSTTTAAGAVGTALVNGAGQTGNTLSTDTWGYNNTKVLNAGDYLEIDSGFYQVISDVTTNGTGEADIDVFPQLREPADGSSIIYDNPQMLCRLLNNNPRSYAGLNTKLFDITITGVEAL